MPPIRTAEQRAEALGVAARQRAALAELREQLVSGQLNPCHVLRALSEHPEWGAMPVKRFLQSIPQVGHVRTAEFMQECGVAANRRLRGMGVSQRAHLARILQAHGAVADE
ncbi:MAG: hypothetical protein RJB01_361 [Actinomycetota bacterium]